MNQDDNKLTKPHDKFFRAMFEDKRAAKDFLRSVCPKEWVERFNLDSIKQENSNFINMDLTERFADLLFSIEISGAPGYVICHFEHQQNAEKFMAVRFLNYATQIWLRHTKNQHDPLRHQLPVIIPILIYTGERAYPYSTDIIDLFPSHLRDIAQETLRNPIKLVDLHRLSDEELEGHGVASIFEIAMKYIYCADLQKAIEMLANAMAKHLAQEDWLSYTQIMQYNITVRGETAELYEKAIRELIRKHKIPQQIGELMLTTAEQFEQRGIEKTAKNMLKRGLSVEDVADYTNLDVFTVKEIYKEIIEEKQKI